MARRDMEGLLVISDDRLGRYGFPGGHPFGLDRHAAFTREFRVRGLDGRCAVEGTRAATPEELLLFHDPAHVAQVRTRSATGEGWLDAGDTPAFRGIYEAVADVVGGALTAAEAVMDGRARRAFVPIAGLHHASRTGAAGFCALNDCGVVIEWLRRQRGLQRVAYVDIDAHHGDGVFYAFEDDPDIAIADLHEDGRYLYPGTGAATETGKGAAAGTKYNAPLPPGADDAAFDAAWGAALETLESQRPEFILLQCGADSIAGDPLAHLALTPAAHGRAARDLVRLAERLGHGRVLALGGGGYNRSNIGLGWCAVVEGLLSGT